jgi:hypothetical protein
VQKAEPNVIGKCFSKNRRAVIGWLSNLLWDHIVNLMILAYHKNAKYDIIKNLAKMELNAIPMQFILSDAITLRLFGIGIIVQVLKKPLKS